MKRSLVALTALIALTIASCSSEPEIAKPIKPIPVGDIKTFRVRILENQTVTTIKMPDYDAQYFKPLDIIWVDIENHRIDDTLSTAMKGMILYP